MISYFFRHGTRMVCPNTNTFISHDLGQTVTEMYMIEFLFLELVELDSKMIISPFLFPIFVGSFFQLVSELLNSLPK